MGSVDQNETALVPIDEAMPELRADAYAKVREWDACRMRLQDGYEQADGEYLAKIRDELKDSGHGLWTRYLEARGIPRMTANERIRKAEGRYIAPKRTESVRFAQDQPAPSAPYATVTEDRWPPMESYEAEDVPENEPIDGPISDDGWPPYDATPEDEEPLHVIPRPLQMTAPAQPRDTYFIEQWNALDAEERARIIAVGQQTGTSGLNKQDTDNIEWARWSWNPITGCLHDCPYCYARDIANRFYPQGFKPTFQPARLGAPAHQRVPAEAEQELGWRNIFTCSMADLFGRWVPSEWIEAVLDVARENRQWNFLFLTKFPVRLSEFTFPDNAWIGTSVDCQARVKNAERSFAKVKGGVKWLSVEPMLEPLHFTSLEMFNWVVIGGASASTQTPAWSPPRSWVDALEADARAAGCMVYEKSNLFQHSRIREYPGWERIVETLPSALAYLPSIEQIGNK